MKLNLSSDWYKVKHLLFTEPLQTLFEQILPNQSFQPSAEFIFEAFKLSPKDIRVVILGDEPYFFPGASIGRAFAVNENSPVSMILEIIIEELKNEGIKIPDKESWKTLEQWQSNGVFLLNTALTVETGEPGSHLKYWENFVKSVITHISVDNPCIWLLWGGARRFIHHINGKVHKVDNYDDETIKYIPANKDWNYVFTAPHPAMEAYQDGKAGFYGCQHFKYANEILKKLYNKKIF